MTKEFFQTRRKGIIYTIFVFIATAFLFLWLDVMLVGRISAMTATEILSVFAIALGVSFFYLIRYIFFVKKAKICVDDEKILFQNNNKEMIFSLAEIVSIRSYTGLLSKIFKTKKVELETKSHILSILLCEEDAEIFCSLIPEINRSVLSGDELFSGKEKYISLLSSFVKWTLLLRIVIVSTLPMVVAALQSWRSAGFYTLGLLVVYLVLLLTDFGRHIYAYVHYMHYKMNISEKGIIVRFGKFAKVENRIYREGVLSFCLKQGIIERLMGLYKVSIETKQKSKGLSDHDYFPFLMKKEDAYQLVKFLEPQSLVEEKDRKMPIKNFVPYIEFMFFPVIAVVVLSVFLTPWSLMLLLPFILFIIGARSNQNYKLYGDYAYFSFGILVKTALIVKYTDISASISSSNFLSKKLSLAKVGLCVGQYTRFFSVGYINNNDFYELSEKLEKKVDKDI